MSGSSVKASEMSAEMDIWSALVNEMDSSTGLPSFKLCVQTADCMNVGYWMTDVHTPTSWYPTPSGFGSTPGLFPHEVTFTPT